MYNPKYLKIVQEQQIEMDELPVGIIRDIKGLRAQMNLAQNLPEEDAKYQAMVAKDEKIYQGIKNWLLEEPDGQEEEEEEEEGVAQTEEESVENNGQQQETSPAPSQPQQDPHEKIILENTKNGRIHERDLTTILGRKPDKDFKVGNLRIRRVFLGDGAYSVK